MSLGCVHTLFALRLSACLRVSAFACCECLDVCWGCVYPHTKHNLLCVHLHLSAYICVCLCMSMCICNPSTVKSNSYLRSNASYRHEIMTIVQPRPLNKTYPRIKEGLLGMLALSAVGWWAGFRKRLIKCHLYFWILEKLPTRIGGERDSRSQHLTAWTWNVAEEFRMHLLCVCLRTEN